MPNLNIKEAQPRQQGLDILRGLMASGVMVYHLRYWHHFSNDYNLLINKIGLYGVSVFYILSGATFFLVYQNTDFKVLENLKYFWIKRFFRIFPLFWVVSLLTIPIINSPITFQRIFLNFTGLFSVFDLMAHLCTGGWSIGVELCFYLMFPILLLAFKYKPILFYTLLIFSLLLSIFFSFHLLDSSKILPAQWTVYVNPFNHLLFFVGGMFLGIYYKHFAISQWICWSFVVVLGLVFAYFPASQSIDLATGLNRIFLNILSLVFCFFFLKLQFPKNILRRFLLYLGEISYSIYLVHPLVFVGNSPIFKYLAHYIQIDPALKVGLLMLETFVICGFVYYFFEKKFIQIGNEMVNRMKII